MLCALTWSQATHIDNNPLCLCYLATRQSKVNVVLPPKQTCYPVTEGELLIKEELVTYSAFNYTKKKACGTYFVASIGFREC